MKEPEQQIFPAFPFFIIFKAGEKMMGNVFPQKNTGFNS